MRTGWVAMRFSWTAYIVPFLFVFSPTLLLQGGSLAETLLTIATAVVGVWFVSAGMIGYGLRSVGAAMRFASIVAGSLLLLPPNMAAWAAMANVAGAVLAVGVVSLQWASARRRSH